MIITEEMQKAIQLIESTNESIYITGKAGTGKTTFLKYIIENLNKRFVVTASTGIAAINAGGVTLHSFFNIPFSVIDPNESVKKKDCRGMEITDNIDVLVIDEISMVRPDIIDYIDKKLQKHRGNDLPFGGMQVVMFGDLYQLPPVVKAEDAKILSNFYRAPYFFYAQVFKRNGFHVVELSHIFRQSDPKFVRILNNIRNYQSTEQDIDDLESTRNCAISRDYNNGYIHLCSLRKDVNEINTQMLGEPTHVFCATTEGDFNTNSMPCDSKLSLRVGARVMTIVNKHGEYYNGSLGNVIDIDWSYIAVKLDNGDIVNVERHKWTEYKYVMEDGKMKQKVKGHCIQFPLTLAWAITIHKSQGLTFDKVVLHIKQIFSSGQLYVGLSRCTSLNGVATDVFIDKKHVLPNAELLRFEKMYKSNNNKFDMESYKLMRK